MWAKMWVRHLDTAPDSVQASDIREHPDRSRGGSLAGGHPPRLVPPPRPGAAAARHAWVSTTADLPVGAADAASTSRRSNNGRAAVR
jgi:hypothetical protein